MKIEIEDLFKVLDRAVDQEKVFEAAMYLYAQLRWGHYDQIPNAQRRLSRAVETYLDKYHPTQWDQEDYLDLLVASTITQVPERS